MLTLSVNRRKQTYVRYIKDRTYITTKTYIIYTNDIANMTYMLEIRCNRERSKLRRLGCTNTQQDVQASKAGES